MKKTIALGLVLSCALPALAASPESMSGGGLQDFAALGNFKPVLATPSKSVPAKPAAKPLKTASMQTVSVSGSLNMNGTGNVMRGSRFVMVNFSGYATLTDATGRITSNYTWFSRSVNCNVSGQWVNCSDWPTWYVDFYKDGRHVGQGSVSGSLNASAYAGGGFVNVSAYTNLSGYVTVNEP